MACVKTSRVQNQSQKGQNKRWFDVITSTPSVQKMAVRSTRWLQVDQYGYTN